jgi:hypothetical protein
VAVVEVKKSFGGPTGLTSKAVREAAKRIIKTVEQVCACACACVCVCVYTPAACKLVQA